jgi:hypothetical protein
MRLNRIQIRGRSVADQHNFDVDPFSTFHFDAGGRVADPHCVPEAQFFYGKYLHRVLDPATETNTDPCAPGSATLEEQSCTYCLCTWRCD